MLKGAMRSGCQPFRDCPHLSSRLGCSRFIDRWRAERAQCPVVEYRTERSEGGYAAKAGHGACAANYDRRTGSTPTGNASYLGSGGNVG